jgi:S1-C subfamily serine protease
VFNFYDSETKEYYPNYQNEQDSIPARQRKRLFSKKEDSKVRLGVTVERMVNYNGLKVVEIAPGSIAEKAGLQKFDIIEKFDRVKLNDPKQLQTLVADKIGEEVKLTIRREGKKIKKKVRLQ